MFARMPGLLFLGMLLQYTVMPCLGYLFSRCVPPLQLLACMQ